MKLFKTFWITIITEVCPTEVCSFLTALSM